MQENLQPSVFLEFLSYDDVFVYIYDEIQNT